MAVDADAFARIVPLGDRTLLIDLGERIDPAINARACALAQALADAGIGGVDDVVPAFASVALHYRPEAIEGDAAAGSPFARLSERVAAVLDRPGGSPARGPRTVEIPVCYGGTFGPDLAEVARTRRLTPERVIELHAESRHFVYMIGFAPGHPYIGGLDRRLAMPRRDSPRVHLPAGSVAIALEMTSIYPFDSPGGWNVIGRTPRVLFDPCGDPPCLLAAGDHVRFVPIGADRYAELRAARP